MIIEAWPFLISRNKILDYSVIVAPDRVSKSDFSKLISLTGGDMTEPDVNMWRSMPNTYGQTLTLVFRVDQAWIDGDRARDGFGRLIVWVVGFVLEGLGKEIPVTEEVFKAVNESVHRSYQEFWNQSEHMSVVRSDALYLCFDGGSLKLTLSSSREPQVTSRLPAPNKSLGFTVTEFLASLKRKLVTFFRSR